MDDARRVSRRKLLRGLTGAVALAPFAGLLPALGQIPVAVIKPKQPFSADDDHLLDDMQRLNCCYFWEQASPETGLVKDRCNARKAASDNSIVASIAATGFGLTALCIADLRGFLSHSQARARVLTTLKFLSEKLVHHRGFFYHFATASFITLPISTPVSACGTQKSRRWILRFCFAAFSPAAPIFATPISLCWRTQFRTVSSGHGCLKTHCCCPTGGCRRSAFFPIAGTITTR